MKCQIKHRVIEYREINGSNGKFVAAKLKEKTARGSSVISVLMDPAIGANFPDDAFVEGTAEIEGYLKGHEQRLSVVGFEPKK